MIWLALLAQLVYALCTYYRRGVKSLPQIGVQTPRMANRREDARSRRRPRAPETERAADSAESSDQAGDAEGWPGWPPRNILAPFVLLAVSMQRGHGYVIEDYLRTLGLFGITMSTLYRTLRQMEKDGFLESTWEPGTTGPARRVYTLTDAGRVWLDASAAMMTAYRDTIDRFFGLYAAGAGGAGPDAAGAGESAKERR
jgi:PadR family transcriptional regulator PadR